MTNLYQDAILDAKAVRASAVANAKAALEEAFEPKIQALVNAKITENMYEGYGEEEMEESVIEGEMTEETPKMEESNDMVDEAQLDEILAELDELTQEDVSEDLNEAEEAEEETEEETEDEETEEESEDEETEEAGEGTEEAGEEEVGDETKVIDITLGDLKQVLQAVMGAQADMGLSSEEGMEGDEEAGLAAMGGEAGDEAEISLDEILDEIEAEDTIDESVEAKMEEGAMDMIQPILGAAGVFGAGALIALVQNALKQAAAKGNEKAKSALDAMNTVGSSAAASITKAPPSTGSIAEKQELAEAKKTINTLRKNLQEINLLNAKYLYMNKLFKTKTLTESQKMRVINALDRAKNVVEVKNAYETLKESLQVKKTQIKESIGFASQAAGVAPKKPILEQEEGISRWQKLAGIK